MALLYLRAQPHLKRSVFQQIESLPSRGISNLPFPPINESSRFSYSNLYILLDVYQPASIPTEHFMSTIKHSEEFVVRSYEVGQNEHATLPVIANYFQEAAGKNARNLNFDIEDLHEKGVTWVLYRMHIKMGAFPQRWESVTVNTWPSSGDGIRAFRDYELIDDIGQVVGAGISQWMVLNIKNRRPVRIPAEILEMGLEVEEHKLPADKKPFPEMDAPEITTKLTVSLHDLDMNRHVNNVKYIEWMTGFMPKSMQPDLVCAEINIQYHIECVQNQEILIKTKKLQCKTYLHAIVDANTDNLLAKGVSVWKD
jgi:acyl-ACP thioesterase